MNLTQLAYQAILGKMLPNEITLLSDEKYNGMGNVRELTFRIGKEFVSLKMTYHQGVTCSSDLDKKILVKAGVV